MTNINVLIVTKLLKFFSIINKISYSKKLQLQFLLLNFFIINNYIYYNFI